MNGRGGFSLLELVVALALAGLAGVVAHGSLAAVSQADASVGRTQADADQRYRTWRVLRRALANASAPLADSGAFDGSGDQLRFLTRIPSADGDISPHTLRLGIRDRQLVLSSDGVPGMSLLPADSVCFEYLPAHGEYIKWEPEWIGRSELPAAVRLLVHAPPIRSGDGKAQHVDTLLLTTGWRP